MSGVFERIAVALERIADALTTDGMVDEQEVAPAQPTLVHPLLTWFSRVEVAPDAVSVTHDDVRLGDLQPSSQTPRIQPAIIVQRGRPKNRVSHCGRCGREDTRRMNHSDSCRECVNESWWTE